MLTFLTFYDILVLYNSIPLEVKLENEEVRIANIMRNNKIDDIVSIGDDLISNDDRVTTLYTQKTGEDDLKQTINMVEMAYLHVQGYGNTAMSNVLGITPTQVQVIKSSDKFKAVLSALNTEIVNTARTFLMAASLKAVNTLLKCLDSDDDKTRLKASTEVMDRIGLKEPDQLVVIQKADNINKMDEKQLLDFIKMGMSEIIKKKEE